MAWIGCTLWIDSYYSSPIKPPGTQQLVSSVLGQIKGNDPAKIHKKMIVWESKIY
jgi:hypothetical protein